MKEQLPKLMQVYDTEGNVRRVIIFVVTAPLFNWIGAQGILFKRLQTCMTSEDVKTSKKFVCAAELARVFKSMICLFLTTSFILLRLKATSLKGKEIAEEDLLPIEADFTSLFGEDEKDACSQIYTSIDLDFPMSAFSFGFEQTLNTQFLIEILLPIFSIGLTLISIMIEL